MAATSLRTKYKGTQFRSRLEARWAFFLDKAGIGWEYEPEWLQVQMARVMNWLPDFMLATGQVAEVKGALDEREYARLLLLASGVGGCGSYGKDVVVLGHFPRPGILRWPVQLHRHSGGLWAVPWDLAPGCPLMQHRMRLELRGRDATEILLEGMVAPCPEWAERALTAARGARFDQPSSA